MLEAIFSLARDESLLRAWLFVVASLRLLSVILGYTLPSRLKANVFSRTRVWTDLNARTFAVWTMTTCVLTLVSAFNLRERSLLLATASSFVIAAAFFFAELFVYETVTLRTIALPLFFSGEDDRSRKHI